MTAAAPARVKGYTVKKVYVIICDKCNEDITRAVSGEDVGTRDEADRVIAEHEQVWHAGGEP